MIEIYNLTEAHKAYTCFSTSYTGFSYNTSLTHTESYTRLRTPPPTFTTLAPSHTHTHPHTHTPVVYCTI